MRLLDLFCGAGGAAMGYHRAGFDDIIGVDINPQPDYPFRFIQADAIEFLDAMIDGREDIAYDLIHASPPCQAYSVASHYDNHPDLLPEVRELLSLVGRPFVIENVPNAPMRRDIELCGSMFGLDIKRHRWFETSFGGILTHPCYHVWADPGAPYLVAGNGGGWSPSHRNYRTFEHGRELMQMDWVTTRRAFTEAIPPAYTQYIGEQFIQRH